MFLESPEAKVVYFLAIYVSAMIAAVAGFLYVGLIAVLSGISIIVGEETIRLSVSVPLYSKFNAFLVGGTICGWALTWMVAYSIRAVLSVERKNAEQIYVEVIEN